MALLAPGRCLVAGQIGGRTDRRQVGGRVRRPWRQRQPLDGSLQASRGLFGPQRMASTGRNCASPAKACALLALRQPPASWSEPALVHVPPAGRRAQGRAGFTAAEARGRRELPSCKCRAQAGHLTDAAACSVVPPWRRGSKRAVACCRPAAAACTGCRCACTTQQLHHYSNIYG